MYYVAIYVMNSSTDKTAEGRQTHKTILIHHDTMNTNEAPFSHRMKWNRSEEVERRLNKLPVGLLHLA